MSRQTSDHPSAFMEPLESLTLSKVNKFHFIKNSYKDFCGITWDGQVIDFYYYFFKKIQSNFFVNYAVEIQCVCAFFTLCFLYKLSIFMHFISL